MAPGLQRPGDVLVGVVGRQHDDARLRIDLANPPDRLDALHLRHPQVHQHDVGTVRAERLDGLAAVGGFGDDLEIGLLVDDVGDAGAQQRVIVDDQHARRAASAPAAGAVAGQRSASAGSRDRERRRLPGEHHLGARARGAVTKVSDAPMRSARSRMLVMPKPPVRAVAA